MKKIFLFIGVVFTALTLSGCDFLSDDLQDQISEELCKNDPDNELCDLDAIQDLEDHVVTTFVEDFQMKVQDGSLSEVCEDYISPSNPDLLEMCRKNELDILPEGMTSFTSGEVSEDGNTYKIKSDEMMDGKDVIVKVVIVEIDGKFYLEDYMYMVEEPEVLTIEQKKGYDYYKAFFDMLLDDDKSNVEFCKEFYDGIDNDCNLFRTNSMRDYRKIVSIEMLGSTATRFRGHVTVLKAKEDTGGEGIGFALELMMNDSGEIKVKELIHGADNPLYEEAQGQAQNALYDYINPDIDDDMFMMKHNFANHNTTRTRKSWQNIKDSDIAMMFYDANADGTMSIYFQVREEFGQVQTHRLDVMIDTSTNPTTYKYELVEPQLITDLPTAKANIDSFFDIFTDVGEDRVVRSNMYYGSGMNLDGMLDPVLYCETGEIFVDEVYETMEPGEYVVRVRFPAVPCADGRNYKYTLSVRVNRWEARTVLDINDIDNDCDGLCEMDDRTELFMMYSMYLDDYMDPTITDNMLEMKYFDEMLPESFFDIRKEVQDKKNRSLYEVVGPVDDDTYIFVIIETEGDMMRIVDDKIKITKQIDKATPLLAIVDPDSDDDSIPIDERLAANDLFKSHIRNESVAMYDACRLSVPDHRIDKCTPILRSLIEDDTTLYDLQLIVGRGKRNILRVRTRPDTLTGEWDEIIDDYLVYYYKDDSGKVNIEMLSLPLGYVPPYNHQDDWDNVVRELNDPTIESDIVCMQVSTSSMDVCNSMRTRVVTTNSMIVTTMMEIVEGMYQFTVEYQTADGMQGAVYVYRVMYVNDADHDYSVLEITELPPIE